MGKTKEAHEKAIIETISKFRIKRAVHIFRYYTAITESQFYKLKLHECESIKNALLKSRENACADAIEEMLASDNPTLKIAGYKLICSDEDREKLNTNTTKVDATIKTEEAGMLIRFTHDGDKTA